MFAKEGAGARCIVAYGGLPAGCFVPPSNASYAIVEQSVGEIGWSAVPDGFFDPVETDETKVVAASAYLKGTDYVANKLIEAQYNGQDAEALARLYASVLTARQAARDLIDSLTENVE